MRNVMVSVCALAMPVSVFAHTGAHDAMGLIDGIVHMAGGHIAAPAALIVLLLAGRWVGKRRTARETRRVHGERREGRS